MKAKIPLNLSKAQEKAMIEEINRQIVERKQEIDDYLISQENEIDARILWALHIILGFGKERLCNFYKVSYALYDNQNKWSQGRTEIEALKSIGVDIGELRKELNHD